MRELRQLGRISPAQICKMGHIFLGRILLAVGPQGFDLPSVNPSMHSRPVILDRRALVRLWILLGLFLSSVPSLAHADRDPLAKPKNAVAREHFTRGNRLFRVREFDKAIAEYKAGALIEDAPLFQYNLGQTYRMAGQYAEALWHYENFLSRLSADDPNRATVEELMAQARAEQEKAAKLGETAGPRGVPNPSTAIADHKSTRPQSAQTHRRTHWYNDTSGWVISGVGVVGLSSALYLLVSANGLDDDALSESRELQRQELQDQARGRRLAGYIIGGVGVAALAVGSVKLSIHSDRNESISVAMSGAF